MTTPQLLQSPEEAVRLRGVGDLALSHAEDAVPALLHALTDASWRVRQEAVKGLVRRGGANVIGAVLRALHDQHENLGVVNAAIQVLAQAGVDTLDALSTFLTDPDPGVRLCSALTLGIQNDPRAVPFLIRAMDDADSNVRYHAIEALGRLRASEAVDVLAAAAESRDFNLAFPALEALAAIGDGRASYRLLPLLEDDLLQPAVLEALGKVGGEGIVVALSNLVNNANAFTPIGTVAKALALVQNRFETSYGRGDIIIGLARHDIAPMGIRNLLNAFTGPADPDLSAVANILGWLDDAALDSPLAEMLGRSPVRAEIIEALVRRGPRVTPLLVERLHSDSLPTRQDAVQVLGRIGDSNGVPALLEVLNVDAELTVMVAGALAMTGDRRAYAPLCGLLGHADEALRRAVISALNSLGHPDMAADMVKLCGDAQPLVRESAVRISGYFGYPECTESILACCRDESAKVRRAAVDVLPVVEDARVPRVLAAALNEEDSGVRCAVARSLGQIAEEDAWPLLQKALADNGPWVRYYAIRSVGLQKLRSALDILSRLAEADPAMQVRVAAVEAIGILDGTQALALLLSLVDAPNQDLARAAIASLGSIGTAAALPPLMSSLESADPAKRLSAVRALGATGQAAILPVLEQVVIRDTNPDVAEAATKALAQFPRPEAIAILIALTALPARRSACIAALARRANDSFAQLAEGLRHPSLDVRLAVVQVLARPGGPRCAASLHKALEDAEASVRLAALTALVLTGNPLNEADLEELVAIDPDPSVRRAAQARLPR